MFIAGVSGIAEPPFNDLWTVPGEQDLVAGWRAEEDRLFEGSGAVEHFFRLQLEDFLDAIREGREPLVTLRDGRRVVELFTAIYRSCQSLAPVTFPLAP